MARKLHDPGTVAFLRYNLALSTYLRGRLQEARTEFEELAITWAKKGHRLIGAGPQYYTNVSALWMSAECCLLQEDLKGFERAALALEDPKFAQGIESYPIQLAVMQAIRHVTADEWKVANEAFGEATRIADELNGTRMALLQSYAYLPHLYHGIALRAMGYEEEGRARIARAADLLRAWGLTARASVLPDLERRLVGSLHGFSSRRDGP